MADGQSVHTHFSANTHFIEACQNKNQFLKARGGGGGGGQSFEMVDYCNVLMQWML